MPKIKIFAFILLSALTNLSSADELVELKPRYFGMINYSPLDLLIPNKYGLTIGYSNERTNTWEVEYLRSSFSAPFMMRDLGRMTDQRISVTRRSYFHFKNFNLSYGVSYFKFDARLGSKYLNSLSGGYYPNVDLITLESLGAHIGIGHRWMITENFTVGIDWLSWSQPLMLLNRRSDYLDETNSNDDRNKVNDGINSIAHFPRLTVLKLQLGWTF
jgi:hypothetical protein